ncbi:acyltransferase family protein [Bradyrhizobium embrapense]
MRSEPLDAVRGLAISMVVACHYFGFQFGVLGVDLFFVLSGYLIGGILLDSRDQPAYFRSFYGRRAFRILPLYWLLLAVATPPHWGYYLFFAQAIPWVQHGYPFNEPAFITWSLAIEEQFYLLLPALIFWLPRRWLVRVLWCGVLLAPVWRWGLSYYLADLSWEYLLPGRLDDLFGGVLIACYMRGYCRSRLLWGALACGAPLLDVAYWIAIEPFAPMSIVALICCAITASAASTKQRVMFRPLIWAGRRCYALYLFHIVVINALDGHTEYPAYVALPLICILAEISWRTIEAPLIRYAKKRFAPTVQLETIAGEATAKGLSREDAYPRKL